MGLAPFASPASPRRAAVKDLAFPPTTDIGVYFSAAPTCYALSLARYGKPRTHPSGFRGPPRLSARRGGVAGLPPGRGRAPCGADSRFVGRRREARLPGRFAIRNGGDPRLRDARPRRGGAVANRRRF